MKVPIKDLLPDGLEIEEEIDLLTLGLGESDWNPSGGFRIVGRVSPVREDVFAEGRIEGDLVVACARCLREFIHSVSASFEALYSASPNEGFEAPEEGSAAEEVEPITDRQIDLSRVLRDAVVLEVSSRYLCRDDCLGLCARCGERLEGQRCSCAGEGPEEGGMNPFRRFFEKKGIPSESTGAGR